MGTIYGKADLKTGSAAQLMQLLLSLAYYVFFFNFFFVQNLKI